MRQDTDVARVAASLRAPAIRYRSFGNEPVRTPLPVAEADPYALLGAAMNAAAEIGQQQGLPPSEPWQAPDQAPQHPSFQQQPNWPEAAAPSHAPEPPVNTWPAAAQTESWAQAPALPVQAPPSWQEAPAPTWPEPAGQAWPAPQPQVAQHWPAPAGHEAPPSWSAPQPMPAPVPPQPAEAQWTAPPPRTEAPREAASPEFRDPEPRAPEPAWSSEPALAQAAMPVATVPARASVEPAVASGWTAAPAKREAASTPVVAPAPVAAPAASGYGVGDMSLLRAAEAPMALVAKPALSTLSQLSVAPPSAKLAEAKPAAPRILFPLIEALDLPGGLVARRAAQAEPEPEPAAAEPEPAPLPAVLAAAEIDLPLPALLRLLAADPAESAESFLALRPALPVGA